MRILMISDVYFPRINGVSTSIQTFRKQLIQKGHEVVLLAPEYELNSDADDENIIRIPSTRVIFDPEDRLMHAGPIRKLSETLKERDFDIIHIQTPFVAHSLGLRLSRELGVACIETYHTFFEEYLYNYVPLLPKNWLRALARKVSVRQCNSIDHVIVPSTAMHEVLRDYGVKSNITILPTGIESEAFRQGDGDRFRHKYNIAADRPVLVNVSRIAHEKNIDFLIRMLTHVWQEVPDILMIIAGDGPAKRHLQRLTRNLGLEDNIMFIGYLDRNSELKDCYCSADIFVFSSRTETQGLVLLEAMALGVPVISTAVMGTKDIVINNSGALTAEDDEVKFACKVTRLLSNDLQQKSLGEQARNFAQQWSADVMAERVLQLYYTTSGVTPSKPEPQPAQKAKLGTQNYR
jgi:glycosyltransferase involved in cell wall biosynthesis